MISGVLYDQDKICDACPLLTTAEYFSKGLLLGSHVKWTITLYAIALSSKGPLKGSTVRPTVDLIQGTR